MNDIDCELSHVTGASDKPLLNQTIGMLLRQTAKRYPNNGAIVVSHQNINWDYQTFDNKTDEFAAGLLGLGLKPGERIGIWAPNCAEWAIVQFATAKAGLILVNINPAYRISELEYALNKVECSAIIIASEFKSSNYADMLCKLAPELDDCEPGALSTANLPHLRHVVRIGDGRENGMWTFSDVFEKASEYVKGELKSIEVSLDPFDPINIQFTSGTTGSPKGATLTHHNIVNNGFFVGDAMELTDSDKVCIPVPLYHCFGMVLGNMACVAHGSTMVYPADAFDPEITLNVVENERCTALYGVPTMFISMLDQLEKTPVDLSSLRTGIMAGSPCPVEVMKRAVSEMNMKQVTICYGMTETSPVSFQSSISDSIDRRVSTVGRVHPHLEVKIIDENGVVVPRGVQGELCTRGYSVMKGYWNDDARTAEAIDIDGWMHTGDLATIDAEGFAKITGRLKDMIIRGGENIYPREIEEFLYTYDNVQDVQVFGVPSDKYGEEICAWIIPVKQDADPAELESGIREYCKDMIAHYKVPRYIKVVDEFPMTVTGKIQKFIMRDEMSKELGLVVREIACPAP